MVHMNGSASDAVYEYMNAKGNVKLIETIDFSVNEQNSLTDDRYDCLINQSCGRLYKWS